MILQNLKILMLDDNQLSGCVPDNIGNLQDLEVLHLQKNDITFLPESICDLNIESGTADSPGWQYYWITDGIEHGSPSSYFYDNALCPPYPSCFSGGNLTDQEYVGSGANSQEECCQMAYGGNLEDWTVTGGTSEHECYH